MRYYLIAGERSGDLHGGNLIRSIRRLDDQSVFRGFGGDEMMKAGLHLVTHYERMALMGVLRVIANLRSIYGLLRMCREDILSFKPDVVILIDYAGFNMRMAKWAKKKDIIVFFYISPKVWAWRPNRALALKKTVDRMFCILPFEKEFYKRFDWEVDYVGNPVLDAVKSFRPDPDFMKNNNFSSEKKIIALLPGSRKNELQRITSVMTAVVKKFSGFQFICAAIRTLPKDLYEPLRNAGVKFVFDSTYDLLANSFAAIVTSGTATLETALLNVPQVVVYKAGAFEYAIGSSLVKVRFISLVNLVANRKVVEELIQSDASLEKIQSELDRLLNDQNHRNQIQQGYREVLNTLDLGSASENTARLMVERLR